MFAADEFIKPETTLEVLSKLKPAFRLDGNGSVTAGNASGLNDGAAALLIASDEALNKFHLQACGADCWNQRCGRRAAAHGHGSGSGVS